MKTKVITDEVRERIVAKWDNTIFSITKRNPVSYDLPKVIILNPREAQEIANFINENNGDYQRELREKKLMENIEKLG